MKNLFITICLSLFLIMSSGCSQFTGNDIRMFPTVKAKQRTREEERIYKYNCYRIWAGMIQRHCDTKGWTTEEIMAEIATQEYFLKMEKELKPSLSSYQGWI